MGFDRQFYADANDGMRALWNLVSQEEGCAILAHTYIVPEDGDYCLQYISEPASELFVVSHDSYFTPRLYGENPAVKIFLRKGENTILVRIRCVDSGRVPVLYSRLFDSFDQILREDMFLPDKGYERKETCTEKPDLKRAMPGTGAGYTSCGRFGFTKGDGVLDYSMPAFGIVSRPFITGNPKYRQPAMWSFSLLPHGERETGSLSTSYDLPANETIESDWTHVKWQRNLADGKFISFDYSILAPSLLIETDMNYIRVSRLKKIGVYKTITFPTASGFLTRESRDGIYYDRKRDGCLTKNFVLFTRSGVFPEVPILFSFQESPQIITGDQDSITLAFDGPAGFCHMTFLYGIELFEPCEITDEWYRDAVDRSLAMHSLSLARPMNCHEYGFTAVAMFTVNRIISRRFYELKNGISHIGKNNLSYRIPVRSQGDEFTQIALHFNQMCDDLEEMINKNYVYQVLQQNAEYRALQASVNPHFLYNSLEAIRERMDKSGQRENADMILLLARIFEYQIRGDSIVTIRKELKALQNYIDFSSIRLQYAFDYSVVFEEEILDCTIPKQMLQPIMENYFMHGFRGEGDDYIDISGYVDPADGMIHISFCDNGKGLSQEKVSELNASLGENNNDTFHIGLCNVHNRLKIVYTADSRVEIVSNEPERGISVSLVFERVLDIEEV